MIGKKVPRNPSRAGLKSKAANIRDLTSYIAAPGTEEKLLYDNGRGFQAETLPGRQNEMISLALESARSRDPVAHYVLSWREGEQPTNDQVEGAVTVLLEELGLVDHQALYGLHRDTENIHLHVAVNRVHPVTNRAVSPNKGFDIEAVHRAIARIEHAQGWQTLPNARYQVLEDGRVVRRDAVTEVARQPSQRSRDYEQRTGAKSTVRSAIEQVGHILREGRSWEEVHQRLGSVGARLERRGSGAVVWLGGQPFKASAMDRAGSLGSLEKRLGPLQDTAPRPQPRLGAPAASPSSSRTPGAPSPRRPLAEIAGEALPLLQGAASWKILHARLARVGMSYERKGSGAVVRADGRVLKASSIDRQVALGALERRLGPYEPPATPGSRQEVPARTRVRPAPLDSAPGCWGQYSFARRQHYERKDASLGDQRRRHEADRAALLGDLRRRRDETLELARTKVLRQALRSVLAAEAAASKAELRDRHQRERKAVREVYQRFPDFEQWLKARDPKAAGKWRYRGSVPGQLEGPGAGPARPRDIRDFVAFAQGAHVYYHRAGGEAPASFVDRGRTIQVYETQDSATVLGSLQLAAQKWGRIKVSGDDRFKAECVRLAAEHGFQLENPGLDARVKELRTARRAGPGERAGPPAPLEGWNQVPRQAVGGPAPAGAAAAPRGPREPRRATGLGDQPGNAGPYFDHLRDLAGRTSLAGVDASRIDAMIAVRLRATGHGQLAVAEFIERGASAIRPAERPGALTWRAYGNRAAAFAFGEAGTRQLEATQGYHRDWRAIEANVVVPRVSGTRQPMDVPGI